MKSCFGFLQWPPAPWWVVALRLSSYITGLCTNATMKGFSNASNVPCTDFREIPPPHLANPGFYSQTKKTACCLPWHEPWFSKLIFDRWLREPLLFRSLQVHQRIHNSPLWDPPTPRNSQSSPYIRNLFPKIHFNIRRWVITKYTLTKINTRWEATQSVMAAKLTRLTHKIAIKLRLVAESCTICSSRFGRPVRELLVAPSYSPFYVNVSQLVSFIEDFRPKFCYVSFRPRVLYKPPITIVT
jgi:hypothetical protein